eukprot:TRINITY_DN46205_c0_g1_i1.p3 TRINITY_DN46205_c0_g1~~TRINITY_DN46205_c0_g1_i1.p3  ORF type:complete len:106 (+),score=6.91 TRINITY_DN46205_c0_g1_i1:54-371(+)
MCIRDRELSALCWSSNLLNSSRLLSMFLSWWRMECSACRAQHPIASVEAACWFAAYWLLLAQLTIASNTSPSGQQLVVEEGGATPTSFAAPPPCRLYILEDMQLK